MSTKQEQIQNILDSYTTGRYTQMTDQINNYDPNKFFLDLYEHVFIDNWLKNNYKTYSGVMLMFHLTESGELK